MAEALIKVIVAGARGRMGAEAVKAVSRAEDMELVACLDRSREAGGDGSGEVGLALPMFSRLETCLDAVQADVLIDFTRAAVARTLLPEAVAAGLRPVIGTTGLAVSELHDLDVQLRGQERLGLYAPNFAIGALLMMRMAEWAARYMDGVEIIEYHHAGKIDAPSGTAARTAQRILQVRAQMGQDGGARWQVPIHSVRLPGFVAHQEVIFGGAGERLTIRHDSMDRTSFMPGVLLAVRSVMKTGAGLIDGLEHVLW